VKLSPGWWKAALKYAIAVLLLAMVVGLNWSKLVELFSRDPQPEYFAATLLLMVVVVSLQYFRWFVLVRALDLPFTLAYGLRLGLVGTFYNSFLPGAVGGDFVKAYLISKGHPSRRAAAVSTVIADRLLGLFGLILYAAVVGGVSWAMGNPHIESKFALKAIITVCIALASGMVLGYVILEFLPVAVGERLRQVRRVGGTLGELWDAARRYRQKPGTILLCVGISALAHTGLIYAFHTAVQAFPPANPNMIATLPETFVIAPIGFIAQALIPLPGGLGAAELTFGGLYELLRGKEGEAVGLAGRLTLRLAEWVIGLAGYAAYLRTRAEIPSAAAAPELTASGLEPSGSRPEVAS
jgi:uncharacterized membrane protein YbhN (UPF0104 family)